MPRTRRLRGLVALPAVALLASVLTVSGTAAAPAAAEPGCLTESKQGAVGIPPLDLGGSTCDDEVPPVIDPNVTVTPALRTTQGWVSSKQLTFAFTGRFTDTDPDPLGFQCQFYASSSAPTSWTTCGTYDASAKVWKQSYTGLDESDAQPYTFRVRAVDTGDAGRDPRAICGLGCQATDTDVDDFSAPLAVQARVDTIAPAGSARINGLVDEENPEWPMVTDRSVQVVLGAGGSQDRSPVDFDCTLSGRSVPCALGTNDLRQLAPGDQRFEAVARDAAGNVDPTPAVLKFSVPRNLTAGGKTGGSPWKVVRQGGYFGGDFLQTTKVGAVVTAPGKNVRELRLIAPRGPQLGKVEIKIGQSIWRTVNLKGARYERFHVYQVRDQFDPLVSGRIQVRAKKIGRGETVRIDAIHAH